MSAGLEAHGVDAATAQRVGALPPVSILFAAFLGYNPIQHLVGPHVLAALSPAQPGGPDRPHVLPAPHLGPVPRRAARGVRVRDRRLPRRGGGVAAARRPHAAHDLARRRGLCEVRTRGRPSRKEHHAA